MKKTKIIMGMPVTIEIVDCADIDVLGTVFAFFKEVDQRFSPFKKDSEISHFNAGKLKPAAFSKDMETIFQLAQEAKKATGGYFDIYHQGRCDPSGLVKGWAIEQAAKILKDQGFNNFYIEAGGDIQVAGYNKEEKSWRVGIKNPFSEREIVKALQIESEGVATSGTYERGPHIYNPKTGKRVTEIVSLTVIGPNIYQADLYATAAFAMGKKGIEFINQLPGFEGYLIAKNGQAVFTSGLEKYFI